ncbi:UDP-N-acetylmuramoyl-L-alanyl-D-glutamate--2,6-diaminopimelate ligase [Kordiimonas pumila]|uniref:UDP-N-acetylmuramoyl-L-alanyl-D-glutamate--2,6-diaminopimelate ligase n=1 Tax=Kordiimonas pumila TaxID=2161677 RepID=A0ABV7D805_9PROT|nr:UDP-N-acetylmuramoyl-L-alanyl-D-glutamate--2,6-diaminopimelate ligase [Kordiimonas pumila]
MSLTLAQLLGGKKADGSVLVSGLTVDSRAVQKDNLFVALPGTKVDGRRYIQDAIRAGASAILTTPGVKLDDDSFPVVEDSNPRRRYAEMAARFYAAQPAVQVAVTGTNGKTSVADFCRQLWGAAGHEAASLGTLGVRSEVYSEPSGLTTPDPMGLHKALKKLVDAGVTHAALEASSHGLDQYRLDGVSIKAAGFTNLTRDHLDYHKTEQGYFYAKARLFGELLGPGGYAVINIDNKWGSVLDDIAWGRGLGKLTVGRSDKAGLRIISECVLPSGQVIKFAFEEQVYEVELPLVGGFQAENALLAAGLVIASGADTEKSFNALSKLAGVSGRMELVGHTAKGGSVFVDYAHTPNGLETVLLAARAHNPTKLHTVFGCGGDRDKGKRAQMGMIAAALADYVYVTDDNPRTENAATIRSEIIATTPNAIEIGDRATAIAAAITAMSAGDMLVVAGKGHEEGQIIGDQVLPFSDIETVKRLLNEDGGRI